MDRFFVNPGGWGETVTLLDEEAHHCGRVMRKRIGDEIVVFDGQGREATGTISRMSKAVVEVKVRSQTRAAKARPEIEIAVGIPKGKSFDLILQKAVELGVSRIQPLMSAQGNVRFREDEGTVKTKKWQRGVLEACKQCGQNHLPEVAVPLELDRYLDGLKAEGARFVGALLSEAKPFREWLTGERRPDRVVLLIGPEGDFSKEEYRRIRAADFAPVDLGDLVLRTETAVFAMIAAVRYQFS